MIVLGLLGAIAAAACDAPASAEALVAALDASEASFATMDVAGFTARTDELAALLPCLDVPLESATVARVHRLRGIRAFVDRDADLTVRAFAAARRLEPEYRLAEAVVPEGHPLRTDYAAMDPATITTQAAPRPADGRVAFDGRDTLERPIEVPTYLQRLDGRGAVVEAAYLLPGAPLPAWPAARIRSPLERPLLIGSIAGAVVSGALLGAAAGSRAAYEGVDLASADGQARLDPLRGRTNALVVASAVGAGLTVAGGVGFVAVALPSRAGP